MWIFLSRSSCTCINCKKTTSFSWEIPFVQMKPKLSCGCCMWERETFLLIDKKIFAKSILNLMNNFFHNSTAIYGMSHPCLEMNCKRYAEIYFSKIGLFYHINVFCMRYLFTATCRLKIFTQSSLDKDFPLWDITHDFFL